jgi:hypothetical protein
MTTLVEPRVLDLGGGFLVRRAVPSIQARSVGPFVFVDHMGPAVFEPGRGIDVRPHPHIGLATVTFLWAGTIRHRDTLGSVQDISPGDVNWMTAGRGIAHSERTPEEARTRGSRMFGLQSWVALPVRDEERDPAFAHHDAGELPMIEGEGKRVRLVAGSLYGARSPVATLSEMFYADALLESGGRLEMPMEHEERAAYVVEGTAEVEGEQGRYADGQLLVFRPGAAATLRSADGAPLRVMLLGGATMDGPRHIWWNFVSSSRERIEQAKADWKAGRFAPVPGESEWIPLPGDGPVVAKYP